MPPVKQMKHKVTSKANCGDEMHADIIHTLPWVVPMLEMMADTSARMACRRVTNKLRIKVQGGQTFFPLSDMSE